MKVSLIITHYRTSAMLKLSLGYFKHALDEVGPPSPDSYGEASDYQIIVADSGTTSETRDCMAGFPDVLYLPNEKNLGYAKAVNNALHYAKGKYVFVANADIVAAERRIFYDLLTFMENNPKVGVAGPALLNFDGTSQYSAFHFYSLATILARRTFLGKTPWGKSTLKNFFLQTGKQNNPFPVDWLMGSFFCIRKKALEQVGPLDERFFMYMEDVDWCRRFWLKNWQVMYIPSIRAYHYHFQASKKWGGLRDIFLNWYTRLHLLSAVKYFQKYGLHTPHYDK